MMPASSWLYHNMAADTAGTCTGGETTRQDQKPNRFRSQAHCFYCNNSFLQKNNPGSTRTTLKLSKATPLMT
jgi:hypothetical protein